MRLPLFALILASVWLSGAHAQGPSGRVTCCFQAVIKPDGTLDVVLNEVLKLDDGRIIERRDGQWTMTPSSTIEVLTVEPLDLSVYREDLIGRRVRVQGTLQGVGIESAIVSLPGRATLLVRMSGLPRDQLRSLIQACGGYAASGPSCRTTLVGTVGPNPYGDGASLSDVVIETPDASRARVR